MWRSESWPSASSASRSPLLKSEAPSMTRLVTLLTLAALLSACAVGPDHQPPEPIPLTRLHHDPAQGGCMQPLARNEARFWAGFDDPVLARLIEQTLSGNQSLQAALARYQEAEALLR